MVKVRLGYACISDTLKVTSSSTYSYSNFIKEQDFLKLDRVILSNFFALESILKYNIKNNIHFYRLSSNLIPLATKKEVDFDYINKYKFYYRNLGKMISDSCMRVDFHPSEYCVINSVKKEVVNQSIELLEYHYNLLDALNIKDKMLVIHVGNGALGKKNAISRFCNVFLTLDKKIQDIIAIENDDKVFNIDDCLLISKRIGIPVVFDYHHNQCNPGEMKLEEALNEVFASWRGKKVKMHFSSPKSKLKREFRSHHEYIESDSFINFLEFLKKYNYDIDIMIEAKKKDEALFRLVREIKYKTEYLFLDDTSFIV